MPVSIPGVLKKRPKVFVLSPAVATTVFFALEFFMSFGTDFDASRVEGAAASAPAPTRIAPRIVRTIPEAREARATAARVPSTELEMLRLIDVRRTVVFAAEEVDALETRAEHFEVDEVDAIRGKRVLPTRGLRVRH